MNITVIYAHPYGKSFNSIILDRVINSLNDKADIEVIDLNKDGFNPVMTEDELAVYAQGKFLDPMIEGYQTVLKKSEHLIFIFPIWWGVMPAILKGFIDKVFLKNFAFDKPAGKLPIGLLNNIKSATVINTMSSPFFYYRFFINQPIKNCFIKGTLNFCGIEKVKWFKIDKVDNAGKKKREKFLFQIQEYCKNL